MPPACCLADIRPAEPRGPALEEREARVLAELGRDCDARVGFAGLRRRLGLHQQALARTLQRLERDGLVARDASGWQLTDAGCAALHGAGAAPAAPATPREVLPVAHLLLPPGVDAEGAAARLARRWFKGLRWFGRADAPGETVLTWTSEADGAAVRIRVSGGALSLETEVTTPGGAGNWAPLAPLVAAVAEIYAPARAAPRRAEPAAAPVAAA